MQERRVRWLLLSVIFGVIQVFAGAPEMTVLTFLTLFGWLLFAGVPGKLSRRLFIFCAVALLVAGIASIQIIPTAEMVQQSMRSANSDYNSFSAWSVHPKRLPEMVFSGLFGYTDRITKSGYWGGEFESMGFPFILSIYFGILTISLAIFGIFARAVSRKLRLFLIFLTIVATAISIGRNWPGFQTLYSYLPFASAFRYPVKFLALAILPISLLAAFGMDHIFSLPERKKRIAIYFWLSAVILVCASLIFTFYGNIAEGFVTSYFGKPGEIAAEAIRHSLIHTALCALAVAIIYQYRILKPNALQQILFVIVLFFDLMLNGFKVIPYAPSEFFTDQPQLVKTVKKEIGHGHFYRSHVPPNLVLNLPSNEIVHLSRWQLETLQNYTGALYDIPVIYHEDYDNLAQKELVMLTDYLIRLPFQDRLPFLTAGAVSVFMTTDQIEQPNIQRIGTVRAGSNMPFHVYRNSSVKGISWVLPEIQFVANREEAFQRMKDSKFDPVKVGFAPRRDQAPGGVSPCNGHEIQLVESQPMYLKFRAHLPCGAYVYFAQPHYAGWITLVDGIEVPSLETNYAFSASFVNEGDHEIERLYKPKSVFRGLVVTSVSVLLLACFAFLHGRIAE
jgi:hypothetical protein